MFWNNASLPVHASSRGFLWFNAFCAYAGWFLCVTSAGTGFHHLALALVALLIGLNIVFQQQRGVELVIVVVVAGIGTLMDTGLIQARAYSPVGFKSGFCPFWITMLWANFATTLRGSLRWLQGRPLASMLLGSVCGPLSYAAATRFGAAELHDPLWRSYALLASAWAAALPSLFFLVRRITCHAAVTLLLVLINLPTSTAWALEVAGVSFPEQVHVHGIQLQLRGVGLLRYRVVFKGYVAALYLPATLTPDKVLADAPKRLEIHYFWSIPAHAFGEAASQILSRNFSTQTLDSLRERIELLHRAYEDVKPGDRYALTYVPEIGTELTLNGQLKTRIQGADFAAAYFAIWLGRDPLDRDLKHALLGLPAR